MKPQKEYWNIDENSGALLQALIYAQQPKEILEVGTSNGYSAILMGKIASLYGGTITTIEFFEARAQLAQENIKKEGLSETIKVLQGDAVEILANFSPSEGVSFNFIFLDANKEEYATYFQHAMQIIKAGGMIVADNTISHASKLTTFFTAVHKESRASSLELSIGTGLMIIRIS